MVFHEKLHELRINNKFTAQYVADFLGISLRAYRFYESGSRQPNFDTLIKIADLFGVSTDTLLCRNFHGVSVDEL